MPVSTLRSTLSPIEQMTFANTTILLTLRSESTTLTAFLDRITNPVHTRITTNSTVRRINQNNLVVLVSGILGNPVRVEDTQILASGSDTRLSKCLQAAGWLELGDTLRGWLTVYNSLADWRSASTTDTDSVDDKSLLGLVSQASVIMALIVSSAFRRSVAEPIVQLADTARVVSQEQNYAIRATATGGRDEMSVLIRAFNDMLSQIQRRDTALQHAREELEQRVDDRTRQLVAANRELEAFSYSVSHDLRGRWKSSTASAASWPPSMAPNSTRWAATACSRIDLSTHRMSELIEDLLNLSRVSTTTMHHEKVNLSVMARGISEQLWRREPERNVEFHIHECPTVEGDARLLRIVLENLLRNAWKYTSHNASAHIEFGCQERRGHTTFYVRDDGAGFDPAQEGRLFKPFQRLH